MDLVLVETFKFKKGCYKTLPTDMTLYIPSHTGQLRGHSKKIFNEQCRLGSGRLVPGGGVGKSWWGGCNFSPAKRGGL